MIGHTAALSLHDELGLEPKPGLVTLTDRGSHDDMDRHTFERSLFALRPWFEKLAALGGRFATFAELEACGQQAEAAMVAATGGINTHRGAIFMLGLLCAAAGATYAEIGDQPNDAAVRGSLARHWGADLALRARRPSRLPGGMAAERLGLRSASHEAALAFPVLFEVAVPALRMALRRGLPGPLARIDTLFQVIAVLDDANLAKRGGREGLEFARGAARRFIAAGGSARPGGLADARSIGQAFVKRRLSPGGAADTLAAACLLARICRTA
jgi:triphosphoribosyl-dephospho-CoA synthase